MIQCALNGSWTRDDHPEVPVTLEQVVAAGVACAAAGAAAVHFHPRRPGAGHETLDALARAIDARTEVLGRPRLWHGDARASWAVVDAAQVRDTAARVAG
jgi:uncharacterized protein (DUF849 family)